MLIFDEFPDRKAADAFVEDVGRTFNLTAEVFDDAGDARAADPGAFAPTPPVVHVDHCDDEGPVIALAEKYGARHAGT